MHTQLVVLGGGPGGYAAAFLAADEGMDVTIDRLDARTTNAEVHCVGAGRIVGSDNGFPKADETISALVGIEPFNVIRSTCRDTAVVVIGGRSYDEEIRNIGDGDGQGLGSG